MVTGLISMIRHCILANIKIKNNPLSKDICNLLVYIYLRVIFVEGPLEWELKAIWTKACRYSSFYPFYRVDSKDRVLVNESEERRAGAVCGHCTCTVTTSFRCA